MSDDFDPEPEPTKSWNSALPEHIPAPTFAPAALAFGISFFTWGLITSPVLWVIGLAIFVIALASWIGEIRHEAKRS
jgi:uncharacterized membrane protein